MYRDHGARGGRGTHHEGRRGGRRGERHGGRHGGRRSLLMVRLVEPAILSFLSQGEAHGYTLLEKLENMGLVDLHPSMVYRLLRQMEENGWIRSDWEEEETQGPPRRVYALTADGQDVLKFWGEQLQTSRKMIDQLLSWIELDENEESV